MTRLQQFDEVLVAAIRGHRFDGEPVFDKRHPHVGDRGTILAVFPGAYEVDSSDADGSTVWLNALYDDEVSPLPERR